jgi:hypothetical protein
MTAVSQVKEELSRVKAPKRCCRLAELSALLHTEGSYRIRGHAEHSLVTESSGAQTARKIYTLIHSLFDLDTPVVKVERSSPRRGSVYSLEVPDQPGFHQAMNELGVLDNGLKPEKAPPGRIVRSDCCASAALRGAFLGGGYISAPYGPANLELTFSSEEAAGFFASLAARRGIPLKLRRRRGQWVLYSKSRRAVSDFLALTGAHASYLEWESHSILSSTKNEVNRLVNCDSADARRLADASMRQRETVARLEELGLLQSMEEPLVEVARLRLEYPQASLSELGSMLEPPVSKAVVQSRMRKLASALERASSRA